MRTLPITDQDHGAGVKPAPQNSNPKNACTRIYAPACKLQSRQGKLAAIAAAGPVQFYGTLAAPSLLHLSETDKRAYILADNKLAEKAGWDREILAIELQALVDLNVDIELTGFEIAEIDIILDEAREVAGSTTTTSLPMMDRG